MNRARPDWIERTVSDLCDVTRGASPRPIHDWIATSGTPWVKIADATRDPSKYLTSTREFIRDEGRSRSVVVKPGDFIVSNSATPGIPKIMAIEACIHDGWLLLKNLRGVDPNFLYYSFLNDRATLAGMGNGSVFTNLKTEIVKGHRILVPPMAEQRAIADVLGALDDKIAANSRLVASLHALAELFYVAVAQASEQDVAVGDVMSFEYGKPLPAVSRKPGEVVVYGSGGVVGQHDHALVNHEGVVVGRKGTAGAVHWAAGPHFPIDTTYFVVPTAANLSSLFCYFALKSLKLDTQNSDSAVPGLNRSDALANRMKMPNDDQLIRFADRARPAMDLASQLETENSSLAHLRDTLLPQLMSGKLRVRDAEKTLDGVL